MNFIAKIKGYFVDEDGTWVKVFISGVDLQERIVNKQIRNIEVRLDDGRHISNGQRKKIYATIKDICDFSGYLPEEQKQTLKYLHIAKTGCDNFSLSNCTMDTAREFLNTILDYCLENGVQLQERLIDRTDDVDHAMFKCIKERVCCICGKPKSDLHHVDAVGSGRNRNKIDDSKHRKMCLCRNHHTEYHTIGAERFYDTYHVYGIIYNEEKSVEEKES